MEDLAKIVIKQPGLKPVKRTLIEDIVYDEDKIKIIFANYECLLIPEGE